MTDKTKMSSYPLKKIYPDISVPGDLFVFIDGHFIKLINANDQLSREKYDQFLSLKYQFIFIHSDDVEKFDRWSDEIKNEEKNKLIEKVGAQHTQTIDKHLDIKDEVLDFLTNEVTEESIQNLLVKTRSLISEFKDKKADAVTYIAKILGYSQTLGDHCTNVANLSTYLALHLGYNQQKILENIYIGALLHDYGKVVINLSNIDPIRYPKKYLTELNRHPDVGRVALLLESGVPEESILIIQEHHERHDGKGYPSGLTGNKIYSLTKIVSIVNHFDNIVCNNKTKKSLNDRQVYAFNEISKDKGQLFDPKVLAKCLEALRPIIFHEEKES